MAHPYAAHAEHHKSHKRVHHILKEHPGGARHASGGAFSRVTSKSAAIGHEHKVGGHKKPGRFARGGKVKHGHQTNIAIVVPHKSSSGAGPQAGAAPPPMAAPAPIGPPPGGPPGMPPGMPPPGGPPMRARGGRIKRAEGGRAPDGESSDSGKWSRETDEMTHYVRRARGGKVLSGEATADNLKKWSARASHNSFARGGAAKMTAGAMSGVGRLEKARR